MVRRKLNLRGIAIVAASVVLGVGILTFYVWYQTESVKLGLDLAKSEARIRELELSIESLKLRRAELLDPRRVERIAREKLGLVDPPDAEIVYEKKDPIR
jgi:cell division protein FtsL